MGFKERIEELAGEKKPYVWAQKMGISKGSITNIFDRGGLPNGRLLVLLAEKTDVNLNWLLLGEGPKFRNELMDISKWEGWEINTLNALSLIEPRLRDAFLDGVGGFLEDAAKKKAEAILMARKGKKEDD